MTADLAAANARCVLTVPQAVLDSKPEVLRIIEDEERNDPGRGPSASIECRPGTRRVWQTTSLGRSGRAISSPGNTTHSSRSMGSISAWSTPIPSASARSMITSGSSAVFPGSSGRPRWPEPSASISGRKSSTFPADPSTSGTPDTSSSPSIRTVGETRFVGMPRSCSRPSAIYPPIQATRGPDAAEASKDWGSIRTSRSCAT